MIGVILMIIGASIITLAIFLNKANKEFSGGK